MKRKLKFRAWNFVAKKMYYPDNAGDVFIWQKEGQVQEIMQNTGLKDKNNVEVYEGDIVLDNDRNRLVKWSNQNASFYLSHTGNKVSFYKEFIECGQWQSDGAVHCDSIEVIGNIYSNPELITDKQKQTNERTAISGTGK